MHIAIDARIINSSTGRYVERLIHYLEKIDITNQYSILVRKKDETYYIPTNPNFTVRVAEFDNYSLGEQIGFKFYLDKLGADLVHFCMPQQPLLYRGKSVMTMHDLNLLNTYNSDKNWLVYHLKQLVGRYVFWSVARKSTHIITPSQYTKNDYVKFAKINPDKVTVTLEAADRYEGQLEPFGLPFERFIMYVGQQPDYKNIRRLAEAHQRLLIRYPDLGLILVGKLAPDAMANKKHFAKLGYKNILFTGFLPDSQKNWLLKNTRAYVFPSLMEGFGLPALEAMGEGAPVIASTATCIPEICGDAAYYFDPTNVDDIADAIDRVLGDRGLRAKLIHRGAKQFEKYSWKRMAEQTLAIYNKALED